MARGTRHQAEKRATNTCALPTSSTSSDTRKSSSSPTAPRSPATISKCAGSYTPPEKLRAGVYASWLWDEQDPSVHLSGFDPAVRFAGVLERQDVGVKVDEAFTHGFERAFGGGARRLEVGWQVEAHAEAEDREIGPPETVGLYPVLPVA